jgi:hypothetical protein
VLVGAVVVHDQVQLAIRVAAGEVAQEDQELLMSMPRLAQPGDLSGRDLQRGEQGCGAVPHIVVSAPFGVAGLHRQRLLGTVQRLDLGLRAPRGAALPDGGERTPSPVCRSRPGKLRAARAGRRRSGWEQP